jgi:hypothetical protein
LTLCKNILHAIEKIELNWIDQTLRRNCLLKQVTEGKIEGRIEVRGKQGRKYNRLLDDVEEMRNSWKLV